MLPENQVVKLTAAQKAARAAIESTYEGVCTVVEYEDTTDEKSKITRQGEVVKIENQPCKLSFEKLAAAVGTDTAAKILQGVTLFVAPETPIRAGSKVIVTQNGVTTAYSASGEPAVYFSHMEIRLELFRGWA